MLLIPVERVVSVVLFSRNDRVDVRLSANVPVLNMTQYTSVTVQARGTYIRWRPAVVAAPMSNRGSGVPM